MTRRVLPRSTPGENLHIVLRSIPWKLLLLLPVLIVLAVPTYVFGVRLGNTLLPTITRTFYVLSAPAGTPTATPFPTFSTALPQAGSLLYTVRDGDSCDEILAFQMRMASAGQVFSDVKPATVKALNAAVGQDCHALQPGMVISLSPQYPLVALGGEVLKIDATSPQQVVPTPLINVPDQPLSSVDCSGGCLLTVRVAPQVQVRIQIETTLSLHVGSWVWTQATLARKAVPSFSDYPYADLDAPLNGMLLHACDLQIDNIHDDNGLSCDQITPNTIDNDQGSWLLGVIGPSGLDHWHYPLHQPVGTHVLLWLSAESGGNLAFHPGNPVYRYDDVSHLYVKA